MPALRLFREAKKSHTKKQSIKLILWISADCNDFEINIKVLSTFPQGTANIALYKDRVIYKIAVWSSTSSITTHHHLISKSSSQFTPPSPPPNLEISPSSQKSLLEVPRKKLKTFGERSFSNAAPEVWKKLPEYIKSSQSTAIFKKNLKTYLFRCSFETI